MEEKKTKICTKCKIEKDVSEFAKRKKGSKDGLVSWCKLCFNEDCKKRRENNKEKRTIQHREWVKNNKEKNDKWMKEYRLKNKEKLSLDYRNYRLKNQEKMLLRKKKHRDENRELYFARHAIERVVSNYKGSRTKYELIIGYKIEDLRNHLAKFGDVKKLQIDHIIPISYISKLITNKEDVAKFSNDLRNLQLLDGSINNKKNKFLTIEYIPYWHLFDFMCYCLELEEFISNQDHHQDQ